MLFRSRDRTKDTRPAIGLCRFSFVGRGDWQKYKDPDLDHMDEAFRLRVAEELYAPERMENRFFAFENFLLNSLDHQTDQNFRLLVLTSTLMPQQYQTRLIEATQHRPYTQLIFSSATDVNAGFSPEINRIQGKYDHPLAQFRIDDDDCLSPAYVEKLRDVVSRFNDRGMLAYSIPKGLVATRYSDHPNAYYYVNQPFHSAGCALVPRSSDNTVFSYGHFSLGRRFPSFVDNGVFFGHLSLKMDDHDSAKLYESSRARRDHTEISRAKFLHWVSEFFPFINHNHFSP